MKVYAAIEDPRLPLREVPAYAARAERLGFTGLLVPEAVHDAFLVAALALEHTRTLVVATSVALAFPRSPTTVAYAAWDLQALSDGRFVLGLGSQVKGNIVGRFGVAWAAPVPRMRDYVAAVRAVWRCWQDGAALSVDSPHYRLTRMQPFFNPGPIDHPDIAICLGAVNPRMTHLAGEAADGLMTHPTNTSPRYLREVVAPALARGAARRHRAVPGVIASTFVATGPDAAAVDRERERLRQYLGFLYSTPQYWATLDLLGEGEVGRQLHQMARAGQWAEMPGLITAPLFDELVTSGGYADIAPLLRERYAGLVDAVTLRMPDDPRHDDAFRRVVAAVQT